MARKLRLMPLIVMGSNDTLQEPRLQVFSKFISTSNNHLDSALPDEEEEEYNSR
jgi:hypothetical protein